VQQLEAELAEARRLLEVRNAELATLQGGAAAAVEPGTEVAVTPEAADAGATTAEVPAAAKPAAKPEAAKPEPKAKPAATEPEPGPSLLQRLGQYWWALLALLAVLGAALLFKRMRGQRGSAEASLEEALAARDLRSARAQLTTRPREGGIVVEEKRAAEPSRTAPAAAAVAATAQRAPETTRKPVTIEDTLSGDGPASIESGDPLAEADFHMAYGLYDQAADLVQLAMKREPQRRDLKLKLLEIFFVWGNRDRFLQLAREMNSSRGEAQAGEWDKILIMGKQIAPEDVLFAGVPRASADSLDMELHSSTQTLDMDLPAGDSPLPDLDLSNSETVLADSSGLDFVFDEPAGRASDDSTISPTIETTARVRRSGEEMEDTALQTARMRRTGEETEEIPVESLGLELDSLHPFAGLDGDDELTAEERRVGVDNERTVESPRVAVDDTVESTQIEVEEADLEDDLDLINSTALIKMSEDTAAMLQQADETETGVIDLSDATGEMPTIETPELTSRDLRVVKSDYELAGEPATMSEVGTKLDLARAYMDMGDPEGARSILDEVLQEGSPVQKQEAERLISSLP
jgi:pilus assembly protein FimV